MKKTHGMSHTRLYRNVWTMMLQRCNSPTHRRYADYGGRGIRVCERWESFENFFEDMGNEPYIQATIERIDNDP